MLPSSAKSKGRHLCRIIQRYVLSLFSDDLQEDDIKITSSGANGEDLQFSPKARSLLPFSIECKNLAKIAIYKYYKQAINNTKHDNYPLLIIKQNREEPLVVLEAATFFRLMKDYNDYKKNCTKS